MQASPHFSQGFYRGGTSGHDCCIRGAGLETRPTCCAPCIHAGLRGFATKSCEKCGLVLVSEIARMLALGGNADEAAAPVLEELGGRKH